MASSHSFESLQAHLNQCILGQKHLVDRLLIALLADGHLLVEGAPGLAKTRAIKALADAVEGSFHRIQFTPDLLPTDVTGSDVYNPKDGEFHFQPGPIFHHLVLADEINRAPAKVQSSLLECMAERQVTVGGHTHPLPDLFLVMATQNPIEQEGTYQLPEAQLDRFLMHVPIDYPDQETEAEILKLTRQEALHAADKQTEAQDARNASPQSPLLLTQQALFQARHQVLSIHMDTSVEDYVVRLVMATRDPSQYDPALKQALSFAASPEPPLHWIDAAGPKLGLMAVITSLQMTSNKLHRMFCVIALGFIFKPLLKALLPMA